MKLIFSYIIKEFSPENTFRKFKIPFQTKSWHTAQNPLQVCWLTGVFNTTFLSKNKTLFDNAGSCTVRGTLCDCKDFLERSSKMMEWAFENWINGWIWCLPALANFWDKWAPISEVSPDWIGWARKNSRILQKSSVLLRGASGGWVKRKNN